jgi:antitoxin (DNA-binding transcriptional repressor) of toxin-antitoxin stability system
MKTMTVAQLKSHFSDVVNDLKNGKEVHITYGRNKLPLATIVPQSKLAQPDYSIQLGTLQKKGHLDLSRFEITDEELLNS